MYSISLIIFPAESRRSENSSLPVHLMRKSSNSMSLVHHLDTKSGLEGNGSFLKCKGCWEDQWCQIGNGQNLYGSCFLNSFFLILEYSPEWSVYYLGLSGSQLPLVVLCDGNWKSRLICHTIKNVLTHFALPAKASMRSLMRSFLPERTASRLSLVVPLGKSWKKLRKYMIYILYID